MARDHPLRRWREENDVTLDAIANDVGVEASHLSMLERGLRSPSVVLVSKLVQAAARRTKSGNRSLKLQEVVDATVDAA